MYLSGYNPEDTQYCPRLVAQMFLTTKRKNYIREFMEEEVKWKQGCWKGECGCVLKGPGLKEWTVGPETEPVKVL